MVSVCTENNWKIGKKEVWSGDVDGHVGVIMEYENFYMPIAKHLPLKRL